MKKGWETKELVAVSAINYGYTESASSEPIGPRLENGRVGYRVAGVTHRTPTAAANSITNAPWSGWQFWGIEPPPSAEKAEGQSLERHRKIAQFLAREKLMPRLHKYRERNALLYVLTAIRGAVITYQLTPDGEPQIGRRRYCTRPAIRP